MEACPRPPGLKLYIHVTLCMKAEGPAPRTVGGRWLQPGTVSSRTHFFRVAGADMHTAGPPPQPHSGAFPGGPAPAGERSAYCAEGKGRDHHRCLLPAGWLWDRALRGPAGGGRAGETSPMGCGR